MSSVLIPFLVLLYLGGLLCFLVLRKDHPVVDKEWNPSYWNPTIPAGLTFLWRLLLWPRTAYRVRQYERQCDVKTRLVLELRDGTRVFIQLDPRTADQLYAFYDGAVFSGLARSVLDAAVEGIKLPHPRYFEYSEDLSRSVFDVAQKWFWPSRRSRT